MTAPPEETQPARPRIPFDPLPERTPFPPGHYIFLLDHLPRRPGGRTSAVLAKVGLFARAGVRCTIATFYESGEVDDIAHELRRRGLLAPQVQVVNLLDYLPDDSEPGAPVEHLVDEPGMESWKDPDQEVYRYFENGVYRVYKRFDYAGRLILRDTFNENRARIRRETFYPHGQVRRHIGMDLIENLPRQEVVYRRDGTPMLNIWWLIDEWRGRSSERITRFDAQGRPSGIDTQYAALLAECLERLIGDGPAFLNADARAADALLLDCVRPETYRVFSLHSAHIHPPGDDPTRLRPRYRYLFGRRSEADAIVFLTPAQRADAELVLGPSPAFKVVPHYLDADPAPPEPRVRGRILMMTRLSHEKQIGHAISAMVSVHRRVPEARLVIYGRGPELPRLSEQVIRLGLTGVVELAGFTSDPAREYERAELVLLTSKWEGLPLTIVESLAHGCPVISYDISYGPGAMIREGVNGHLVQAGNRKELADRIVACLRDPDHLARMSQAARESSSAFSGDAFLTRWADLYSGLVAQRGEQSPPI